MIVKINLIQHLYYSSRTFVLCAYCTIISRHICLQIPHAIVYENNQHLLLLNEVYNWELEVNCIGLYVRTAKFEIKNLPIVNRDFYINLRLLKLKYAMEYLIVFFQTNLINARKMDYKEEQNGEIEALLSIYEGELEGNRLSIWLLKNYLN